MNYKLMHCYGKNSMLLACIDVNAITEMTWHEDGMYIYWRKKVQDFDETPVKTDRAGHIVCDWTKVEAVSPDTVEYLMRHRTLVILPDNAVYDSMEVLDNYITIKEIPELT